MTEQPAAVTLYTAAETAVMLRTNAWQVTSECRAGKIRASKPGKSWLIDEAAIRDYLADHSNVPLADGKTSRRRKRRI